LNCLRLTQPSESDEDGRQRSVIRSQIRIPAPTELATQADALAGMGQRPCVPAARVFESGEIVVQRRAEFLAALAGRRHQLLRARVELTGPRVAARVLGKHSEIIQQRRKKLTVGVAIPGQRDGAAEGGLSPAILAPLRQTKRLLAQLSNFLQVALVRDRFPSHLTFPATHHNPFARPVSRFVEALTGPRAS
jgi:hypothetical protein